MKRFCLVLIFIFSFLYFNFLSPVLAQEFNFNRAYQDYLYTFNQYQAAHKDYEAAKSAYLTYQTLTAKSEAQDATLKMLLLRDETVRTYLTALRLRLAESTGISNYEQNVLYLKLDNEVGWYIQHRDSLSSAGTLEDLVKLASKAQDQYNRSEVLAYQALGAVLAGKEKNFRDRISEQIEKIGNKLDEIRQRGDKQTLTLERWSIEAENKLTLSQQKEFEALQKIAKIKPTNTNKLNDYSKARLLLRESNQYLKEANSYLKEITREVKIAD